MSRRSPTQIVKLDKDGALKGLLLDRKAVEESHLILVITHHGQVLPKGTRSAPSPEHIFRAKQVFSADKSQPARTFEFTCNEDGKYKLAGDARSEPGAAPKIAAKPSEKKKKKKNPAKKKKTKTSPAVKTAGKRSTKTDAAKKILENAMKRINKL